MGTYEKLEKLYIYDGKITKRVDENTPGANRRVIKKYNSETRREEEKIVYELYVTGGIRGIISGIMLKVFRIGDKDAFCWDVYFEENNATNILSIPFTRYNKEDGSIYEDRHSHQFVTRLPNVDFTKKVFLELGKSVTRETKDAPESEREFYFWLKIYQEGNLILPYYNRDNLPRYTELPNGKYDKNEQINFIRNVVLVDIAEKIDEAQKIISGREVDKHCNAPKDQFIPTNNNLTVGDIPRKEEKK
jgi:hypothetical protein